VSKCWFTNELNEKNCIFERLSSDNQNLCRNLEDRKKENESFCKAVAENENVISHISQDKAKCEHDAKILNDTTKKNQDDIQNLCHQLDCLKLKSKNQNDEINEKAIEMNNNQKCLNDVKCDNANLNNKINLKNSSLDTIKKQLAVANQSIIDLQNEINLLEQNHSRGKDQLENLKANYQNEHGKRVQAENDNVKLEEILKDRDNTVNKIMKLWNQIEIN